LEIHKQHKKVLLVALIIASLFLTFQLNLPNKNFIATADVGTQVGGTITSNTTWTTAKSPYIITETIQIPENVNLTIEPGVTITAQPSSNIMFLINGVIQARGNSTNKIIFDGNNNSDFFKTNHPVAKGFLDLNNCVIRNGRSAFWLDNTAYLNLTNSELSNLSQYSYLWYPSQDTFIQFNTFTNTAGIKIGTDDYFSNSSGAVYVKYNLFINNQGYIINNYASYGLSKTYVNNNSFTNTTGIILEVEQTSTTADMDASQNYWGTANTTIIDSMIYDKNDDFSCSSYINYLPILDAPDPDVPAAPTLTPSPSSTPSPETTAVPTITPEPSSSPSTSTVPDNTQTPTAPPANSSTPETTANPNTADQSLNTSTAPTNPELSPTQQSTITGNPPVNDTPKNNTQITIFSLVALVVFATGLIGYFAKHKA
jgi:hypothetical protein